MVYVWTAVPRARQKMSTHRLSPNSNMDTIAMNATFVSLLDFFSLLFFVNRRLLLVIFMLWSMFGYAWRFNLTVEIIHTHGHNRVSYFFHFVYGCSLFHSWVLVLGVAVIIHFRSIRFPLFLDTFQFFGCIDFNFKYKFI